MQLYAGTVSDALQRLSDADFIPACTDRFRQHFRCSPASQEVESWRKSWPWLITALGHADLCDLHILLEYSLPGTGKRVDALVLGESAYGRLVAVVIELKQWSEPVFQASAPATVRAGGRTVLHPARQVGGYVRYLEGWVSRDELQLDVRGIALLHNARPHVTAQLQELTVGQPSAEFPMLGRDDLVHSPAAAELAEKLLCADIRPAGGERIQSFLSVQHNPSPGYLDRAKATIEGREQFRLIGDQDLARLEILNAVRAERQDGARPIVVVTGGPGTGKSAVACRVLADLLGDDRTVPMLLSPSATLTRQLKRAVGERAETLVGTFTSSVPEVIRRGGVAILDEAHRARTGQNMLPAGRFPDGLGRLLKNASASVLFLDERQIIRPNEGVTVAQVKAFADEHGMAFVSVDLTSQFRCNGSLAYLNWVDELFSEDCAAPAWDGIDYDLAVAPDPEALAAWVDDYCDQHAKSASRSPGERGPVARITAGFCWPWTRFSAFPLKHDVAIPWNAPGGPRVWTRPWNFSEEDPHPEAPDVPARPFWVTDPGGHLQVGCIYTAQGMEYDYGAVILGNDLVRRNGRWRADPTASHDSAVNRLPAQEYLRFALNTYRVLATRATKGTRFYSTDPATQAYLQTLILSDS